jgi:nitrate reductase NapE component
MRELPSANDSERRSELAVFVFIVGGYGFPVWIWQMINGPPGPPAP